MAPRGRFELPRCYRDELAGGKFPGSRLTGLGHLGTPAAITVGSFKTICLSVHLRLSSESLMVGLARLAGSVWSLCRSWYRMEGGRIVALFPGFTAEYVKAVKRPAMGDYRMG